MTEPLTQRLTKKFLMSLPNKGYIVSNLTDDKGCSVYDDEVVRVEIRDLQWEKVKQVGADQRTCHVFNSKADFVRFFERIEGIPVNKWKLDEFDEE